MLPNYEPSLIYYTLNIFTVCKNFVIFAKAIGSVNGYYHKLVKLTASLLSIFRLHCKFLPFADSYPGGVWVAVGPGVMVGGGSTTGTSSTFRALE